MKNEENKKEYPYYRWHIKKEFNMDFFELITEEDFKRTTEPTRGYSVDEMWEMFNRGQIADYEESRKDLELNGYTYNMEEVKINNKEEEDELEKSDCFCVWLGEGVIKYD